MLEWTDYYAGAAPGYVSAEKLQRGSGGTPLVLRRFEYASHTAGGVTVYKVSKQTAYRNEDGTGAIETTFGQTFYAGTTQVQQQTTTLPVVPADQNGSGVAATRKEYFDTYGRSTWAMDERGFITHFVYALGTGALVRQIDDVDTSIVSGAPSGWTTPDGGGLNLVTDFENDDQGRMTQTLGPTFTISLPGAATAIRATSWTVYDDVSHVIYAGQGFAFGSGPSYSYTLIDPVSITKMDAGGRVNDEIQATAPNTSGTLAAIIAAAGGGSAAFPQSASTRWTTNQYTDCCLAVSQRVYRKIPASGEGTSGTNYDQTDYGYSVMKRRNRTVLPGGEIAFGVHDARGLVLKLYVGTNDTGATETDPTGGGAVGNTMKLVTANEYDGGAAGGDGNLTRQTDYVNGSLSRVTTLVYDFRNRRIDTDGEIDVFERLCYDNLDRVIQRQRYDTTASGRLILRNDLKYDDRGRTYQTIRYEVDPATGTVGNSLTGNAWHDAAENPVKSLSSGSKLFTKTTYDSLGRKTVRYTGYDLDETAYADAFSVTDDVILEQVETTYDAANNAIQTTTRQRYHDALATQTGPLQNPTTTPNAHVTYVAVYPDALGRMVATADYGTNGGAAFTRSGTIPAPSDTVRVNTAEYDSTGEVFQTTDSKGIVTRLERDDRGREITKIENYGAATSSGGGCAPSDDVSRTTRTTYTPDDQQATLVAENARTGNQTTTWTYGTTLADSDIATSTLLRTKTYPDSTGGTDTKTYTYNRQSEPTTITDQRGCVRTLERDRLGRLIHDRVTTLGTGVDGAIRRLSTTFEVRGLPSKLTSYDNATVGSGAVVNEVQFAYNGFAQLTRDYQSHAGSVNLSSTPQVQLTYANGSANMIRPTSLVYPNGRTLTYGYGPTNGLDDACSRVASLVDNDVSSTHLADYRFLGLGATVVVDFTQPHVKYTLVDLSGTNDPDTGDIYSGLDRFGRVKDCRWYDYGSSTDTARLKYGYDRASNRLWREDTVAAAQSKPFDELYTYDGLHRLKDMQRGTLNSGHTAITSPTFGQCWSLDPTGNWKGFKEAASGGSWTLDQTRTSNTVNEITDITNSVGSPWADPAHDAAGNMTTIPQPADPTTSFTATFDAWNRQVKLVNTSNSQTVQECQYDARTFRTVRKDYTAGTLSEERHFYYTPGWRCIEERLGSSPDTANPNRQFVWGQRYIDDLVCRDRSVSGTLDERLYAQQDANWNVVALTDTTGTVQERYAYDAYGVTRVLKPDFDSRSFSSYGWETTFCGYRFDANTSLYAVRNRFYQPRLGTWINRDPIEYPATLALLEYADSSPLSLTDPSGADPRLYWGDGNNLEVAPIGDRTPFLYSDWERVQYMCGNDPQCLDALKKLNEIINKKRKIKSNRCFSYMDQVMDDLKFPLGSGFMDIGGGTIRLAPKIWDPGRFVPTTPGKLYGWFGMTEHAVMHVYFTKTNSEARFDIGSNTHLGHLEIISKAVLAQLRIEVRPLPSR